MTDLRSMTGALKLAVFVALCTVMFVIVIATEGNPLVVIAVVPKAMQRWYSCNDNSKQRVQDSHIHFKWSLEFLTPPPGRSEFGNNRWRICDPAPACFFQIGVPPRPWESVARARANSSGRLYIALIA